MCNKEIVEFFLKSLLLPPLWILLSLKSVAQPSFDCAKASGNIEKSICENEDLARMDKQLAAAYRTFMAALPEQSRATAKKLQQNWIVNRDRRCSTMEFQGDIADDRVFADHSPFAQKDLAACLADAYRFSLSALQNGVLTSSIFLTNDGTEYPIGVGAIDQLRIKKQVSESFTCGPEKPKQLSKLYLIAGIQELFLGDAVYDFCNGQGEENTIAELRFYLASDGSLFRAVKIVENQGGGRCGYGHDSYLRFFELTDNFKSLIWYSANNNGRVPLLSETYACGGQSEGLESWEYQDGKLIFNYFVQPSWYHWLVFPRAYAIAVDNTKLGYEGQENKKYTSATVSPSEIKVVTSALTTDPTKIGFDNKGIPQKCTLVYVGIHNYIELKNYALSKQVTLNNAFDIAERMASVNALGKEDILRTTLTVFLQYLDEARKHQNWRQVLGDFARGYRQPSHHYFMFDHSWKEHPLKANQFYSDPECLAVTRPPTGALTLEDWIYLFWARRAMDGSLERSENLLRKVLATLNG